MRIVLAAVVVIVMGVAILGIGMGDSPLGSKPAEFRDLPAEQLAASRERLAGASEQVRDGREEFLEEGCGDCHTIGAVDGADGELGPRLDTIGDPLEEIVANITMPARGGPPGYSLKLMPTDYAKRMDREDIEAVAAFIRTASAGGEAAPGGAGDEGDSPDDDDDGDD